MHHENLFLISLVRFVEAEDKVLDFTYYSQQIPMAARNISSTRDCLSEEVVLKTKHHRLLKENFLLRRY